MAAVAQQKKAVKVEELLNSDNKRVTSFLFEKKSSGYFLGLILKLANETSKKNGEEKEYKTLTDAIEFLDEQVKLAKQETNSHSYNYWFTLRRDLRNRYASRKALIMVASDKRYQYNFITDIATDDEL